MGGSSLRARDGQSLCRASVTGPARPPALEDRERINRMRARAWVLQILYLWEARSPHLSLTEAMNTVLHTRRVSPDRVSLLSHRIGVLEEHLDEIDEAIRDSMDNWRLERLSRLDRAVLRLAATELLFPCDVPPRVAIQEGIRLAGQYGGDESPRFVNGVLDAIYRAHTAQA